MMSCDELAQSVLGAGTSVTDFAARSFIELGGDSLRAMRLAALAEERLGVRIPVRSLLGGAPLAAVLGTASAAGQAWRDDGPPDGTRPRGPG